MGIDLRLLPVTYGDLREKSASSFTVLECGRRHLLWTMVEKITSYPFPSCDFMSYMALGEDGESEFGPTTTDSYDAPLQWATAGDLAKCFANFNATDKVPDRDNVAIQAYLAALAADRQVVLYWH